MTTINANFVAYLLSAFGGAAFVSGCLVGIRAFTDEKQDLWNPTAFLTGIIERAIVTTLIIYASGAYLPQFMGAWVALKIAASWNRFVGTEYARAHMIGLIGSALSFGFAIGATLWMRPALYAGLLTTLSK